VTLDGVRSHQQELQAIADDNEDPSYPGTRAAGTAGYQSSVDYVAGLLEDAGYEVTLDEFEFQFEFPALLEQLTPVAATYPSGSFTGGGFGEVTGGVIPVDINLVPHARARAVARLPTSPALDFSGPADIALIQRGTCTFAMKAVNAVAAAPGGRDLQPGNTPPGKG
jgi:hypothetical protein